MSIQLHLYEKCAFMIQTVRTLMLVPVHSVMDLLWIFQIIADHLFRWNNGNLEYWTSGSSILKPVRLSVYLYNIPKTRTGAHELIGSNYKRHVHAIARTSRYPLSPKAKASINQAL